MSDTILENPLVRGADIREVKAPFDRTKDWADLEAMTHSKSIDLPVGADRLGSLLSDDPRVDRLRTFSIGPATGR